VYRKFTQLNFAMILVGLMLSVTVARGQAAPVQFFVVCYSQENLPNVYMSGIMQGPATAIQSFQTGFAQHLTQTYSYQGAVACVPSRTVANAQTFVQSRTTFLHNLKKNLIQTGWTEAAPAAPGAAAAGGGTAGGATNVLSGLLGGGKPNTPAPGTGGGQPAGETPAPGTPLIEIINNLFGVGSGGGQGSGAGGAASPGAGSGSGGKPPQGQAALGKSPAGSGGGAGASTATQVTSVLSGLLGKPSAGGSGAKPSDASAVPGRPGPGGAGGTGAQPQQFQAGAGNGLPAGALGMAQSGNTKITIYGCGRQGTQVMCVTDLTNQDPKETLMQSAAAWKDAFLVDDRGDRHMRTDGFFLNIDGEKRQQMDISYGKSAHFILAFDAVQTKVEKVNLRSATGALNVEDIALIAPGTSAPAGESQPAANQAPAQTVQR
jgi:hypothetical protein